MGAAVYSIILGLELTKKSNPWKKTMLTLFKSYALKEEHTSLMLSHNAILSTADVTSIYTKIDAEVALDFSDNYIHVNKSQFDFNVNALSDALHLVMVTMDMIC